METGLNEEDQGIAEKLAMHIADTAEKYDIGETHDKLSCKIFFIMSLLEKLIPEGHKVLIFSQTRKMVNLIQFVMAADAVSDGEGKVTDCVK
ncbi:unnamed protein product [Lactuca virosa]|uniref:Helicase ATP-binding domain-containing protein n=1 Tax=Lactuca virosa TaxID=75947 RepID=A0AAU9MZL6_9ASTR|nr:unnamed protein product [Lactuca virosa]